MKNNHPSNTLAICMLATTLLIGLLVIINSYYQLTNVTSWYDSILHPLGGIWVSTIFLYMFSGEFDILNGRKNFLFVFLAILGFTALVGILWEFYEFVIDMTLGAKYSWVLSQPGLSDTMKDLANDLAGSVFFAVVYLLKRQ